MKIIQSIILILALGVMNQLANAQCPPNKIQITNFGVTNPGPKRCPEACKTKCINLSNLPHWESLGWTTRPCWTCTLAAQSDEMPSNESQLAVSNNCKCNIPGYGCPDLDFKCRNHCVKVCSHHVQIENEDGDETNMLASEGTFTFSLLHSQQVSIRIMDVNGNLVKILADGDFNEGDHSLNWNIEKENVSNGLYSLVLTSGMFSESQRVVIAN